MRRPPAIAVALLCLGYVGMARRHDARQEVASTEAGQVAAAIKREVTLTNLNVSTSSAGVWFLGGSKIEVYGTVPSQEDLDRVRDRVSQLPLHFPVVWEVRASDGPGRAAASHDSGWREQLRGCIVPRLVAFWGLSPLMFPAILIAAFAFVRADRSRRILTAFGLAWVLWLLCMPPIADGYWYWPTILHSLVAVLPAVAAWGIIVAACRMGKDRLALHLLAPCAIPIFADALYSPLNAGYLVQRFGCGCKLEGMNTNHITLGFFVMVWIVTLIMTGAVSRQQSLLLRMAHLVVVGSFTFWLSYQVMSGNVWL